MESLDGIRIRSMRPSDWPEVREVYAAGIATGIATFEIEPPAWESWDAAHSPELRFVALDGERVVGWVAAGPVSERCCYSGVAEHSVYVAPGYQGKGIGGLLLGALIEAAERGGYWTLQSGIFPENLASLALHRRYGFRIVGLRERLGQLDGAWRDVYLLERRSPELEPPEG